MKSIPTIVESIIRQSPFIEEGLMQGIINLSAYARTIQPLVEKQTWKSCTIGAIVMALKRIEEDISREGKKERQQWVSLVNDLTVRSHLTEYAVHNRAYLPELETRLAKECQKRDAFFNFSRGIHETTLILTSSIESELKSVIKKQDIIRIIPHLASITIHLSPETIETPGVYYPILKALAWHNINIIEVVSIYSELTLVFAEADIDRAFAVVKLITQ